MGMPHLSWTYGQTYPHELWAHVLLQMSLIQLSPQHHMLSMPYCPQRATLYPVSVRIGPDQPVFSLLFRVLLPKSSEFIKYLCRTTDATEWIKRREVKNVKVGTIVDFQDAFRVWRKGIVIKTSIGQKGELMLHLKSFFKGNEIQETIEAGSKRLAPCNFFTRSKYL